MNLIKLS
jgi:hypothetical protein